MLQFEPNSYTLLQADNYVGQTIDLEGNFTPMTPVATIPTMVQMPPMSASSTSLPLAQSVTSLPIISENAGQDRMYSVQNALDVLAPVSNSDIPTAHLLKLDANNSHSIQVVLNSSSFNICRIFVWCRLKTGRKCILKITIPLNCNYFQPQLSISISISLIIRISQSQKKRVIVKVVL